MRRNKQILERKNTWCSWLFWLQCIWYCTRVLVIDLGAYRISVGSVCTMPWQVCGLAR